jgi:hypothetical protein
MGYRIFVFFAEKQRGDRYFGSFRPDGRGKKKAAKGKGQITQWN